MVPEGSTNKYVNTSSISGLTDVNASGGNAPTDGQVLTWDNIGSYWKPADPQGGGGGGSGDITAVVAGTGLTGGASTGSATLNVDVGTGADKIVQLNGSSQLPAVSGALLTNINTDNLTEGSSKLFYTDARFDNRLGTKTTDNLTEGSSNLYFTNARADARITAAGSANWNTAFGWGDHGAAGYQTSAGLNGAIDTHLNQSNPTAGYVLSWNGSEYAWVAQSGGGAGDITAVVAGTGLTGGATSGSATLNVDVGTTANKIVQLDGSAKLPAVDGSNLTNLPAAYTNASVDAHLNQSNPTAGYVLSWNGSDYAWVTNAGYTNTDFDNRLATKTTANLTEGANLYFTNARADARIAAAQLSALSNVHTAAPTDGQVLKWDNGNSRWAPANDTDTVYSTFNTDFDNRLGTKSTTNLAEGTNLYFTNARADARVNALLPNTGSLTEGSNLYYTDARADARITNAIKDEDNMASNSATHIPSQQSVKAYVDSQVAGKDNTDEITEGSTNLYFTNARADARIAAADTDALSEGSSNLYYTDARANSAFDTRLATKSTTNLAEGTNLYYTQARADARVDAGFTAKSTSDLSEGTNLYYTNARADARITAALIDEDNMATNSATRIPSQQSVKAYVDSQVASENELSEMNDVTISAVGNNHFIKYNASTSRWENASVAPATAAGNDTEVQFNDGGVMGSDTGLTYNKASNTLTTTTFVGALTGQASSIANHDTDALTEGSSNLYYTDARANAAFDTRLATKSTTNLAEGTNLYYTDARADARITNALIDEDNMASNSATKLPSQQSVKAYVDAQILTKDNTDEMTEGSTNLYFTNARAISAIQGTNINMGSNNITTTGKVLYSNVYSALVDLPSASTYHGMFAHVHATGKGYFAHGGSWIELANHSQLANSGNWDTAYGWGDHGAAGYLTSVPAQSFASLTGKPTTIAGYGITDAYDDSDFDTRLASKNTANLTEGSNLYFTNERADARIAAAGLTTLSDVDAVAGGDDGKILYYDHSSTSFKWKTDAAGGGSLSALSDTTISGPSNGQVLKYNGSAWVNAADSGGPADTDALSEGSSNLYFTNARADARADVRIGASAISALSNVHTAAATDGQVLTWDNGNSRWAPADSTGAEAFKTIAVSGQSDVVADSSTDTLTLVAGSGIVLTTNAGSDSITVASSGGGGGTTYEEFKINYATNGTIASISNESSNITSVNIDSAAGGDLTVNFQNYTTPPLSFAMYGYNYASNEYNYNTVASGSMTLRKVPGGGSSGSPTAFGSFSNMKIRCAEAETGASRSFGTTTHAWVRFVMGA